jgi:hypothetical protein
MPSNVNGDLGFKYDRHRPNSWTDHAPIHGLNRPGCPELLSARIRANVRQMSWRSSDYNPVIPRCIQSRDSTSRRLRRRRSWSTRFSSSNSRLCSLSRHTQVCRAPRYPPADLLPMGEIAEARMLQCTRSQAAELVPGHRNRPLDKRGISAEKHSPMQARRCSPATASHGFRPRR